MNLSDTSPARLAGVAMRALSILTAALIVSPVGLGAKAPLNPLPPLIQEVTHE